MRINCPVVDQRREIGSDGQPPESGNYDCVPASLASMARGLLPALNGRVTADGMKDAVYGQGYVGLQDPARYVKLLASYGLRLTSHSGDAKSLYLYAASQVMAGRPVLLSIPSDWNNNPPRSSFAHMVALCDVTDRFGTHGTAMNPWTAAYQQQTRDWWVSRMAACAYKLIWVMQPALEGLATVSWHQQPDRTGKDDAGHTCGEGMLNYMQRPEHADLLASDGRMSEQYVSGNSAFLPLASGAVVRGSKTANGWTFDTNGAAVLAEVWALYQALKSAPPPPPPSDDPVAKAALAAVQAMKAALGEL